MNTSNKTDHQTHTCIRGAGKEHQLMFLLLFLLVLPLFALQCRFSYENQNLAEGVGFEPTVGFPTLDFESSALNRTQPPFQSLDIVELISGCAIFGPGVCLQGQGACKRSTARCYTH
jgi:hypothetical protein